MFLPCKIHRIQKKRPLERSGLTQLLPPTLAKVRAISDNRDKDEPDDMDILKNTSLVTGLYIVVAILVLVLGLWREHIYHEKNEKQQGDLFAKQTKINDQQVTISGQQDEMFRLLLKMNEHVEKQAAANSRSPKHAKALIENLASEAIISSSTAEIMIRKVEGQGGAVGGGSSPNTSHSVKEKGAN